MKKQIINFFGLSLYTNNLYDYGHTNYQKKTMVTLYPNDYASALEGKYFIKYLEWKSNQKDQSRNNIVKCFSENQNEVVNEL